MHERRVRGWGRTWPLTLASPHGQLGRMVNPDDVKRTLEDEATTLEEANALVASLQDSLDRLRRDAERRRLNEWTARDG